MGVALQVANLTKRYERFALQDVNLCLDEGAIVGIIGENGAGKTTLIKCILGILRLDTGAVSLPQEEARANDFIAIRQRIGYVPEEQVLYEWMTVERTIRFYAAFYPSWDFNLSARLLEMFNLSPKSKVATLSKGMKVKLLLALALSHHPSILLLDEPTTGLDPIVREEFAEHVRKERTERPRIAALFSSHILSDIEALADEVIFIRDGQFILRERVQDLLRTWKKVRLTAKPGSILNSPPSDPLIVCASSIGDGSLTLLARTFNAHLAEIFEQHQAHVLSVQGASLDDIYLGLARGKVR